jgi:phage terminase large subunit-like protein
MRSKSKKPKNRVDAYATAVVAGEILAGPLVRWRVNAISATGPTKTVYRFDAARRADHAIDFFETVLKLPDVLDDDGYAAAVSPAAVAGVHRWESLRLGGCALGYRRFREAYIEIGKGNGKTPLCAGIGLYGLVMDGERAAEVYAAAADQDQAQILFRDATRIAQASPDLWAILKPSGGDHIWQLEHKPSLSFFKTFSRESGAKSGTRPHIALLDELHEHGTPQISIKIRAGAKRRKQPLFVEITNSGFDRASICWEHHEHSRKVVEQTVGDEQWFAYVCALDEGDDPLTDRTCWPKVNPNLGVSIFDDYLERQVANATNIQAETNTVLRLNFCVWTQANFRAIDMGLWRACQPTPADE